MKRKPQVSYSTASFHQRPLPIALDEIAAAGFNCIELLADQQGLGEPNAASAANVRKQLRSRGMTATTMHAPFGDRNPGTPVESLRLQNVADLSEWIRFAGDIGAAGIVIHAVPNPSVLPAGDLAQQIAAIPDAAERSMRELVAVAAEAQVRLLLENLPYKTAPQIEYPLITMGQLRPFVDAFPAEQLGLVCDSGHAGTLRLDPAAEIELAGERLWGTHLHDVDADEPNDDHWVPTHGGLDWQSIRSALKRIGYQGAWTFEVGAPRYGESPETLVRLTRAVADEWGL